MADGDTKEVNLSGVLATYDCSVRELQTMIADLEDDNKSMYFN